MNKTSGHFMKPRLPLISSPRNRKNNQGISYGKIMNNNTKIYEYQDASGKYYYTIYNPFRRSIEPMLLATDNALQIQSNDILKEVDGTTVFKVTNLNVF